METMRVRVEYTIEVEVDQKLRSLYSGSLTDIRYGIKFEAEDALVDYLERRGVTIVVNGERRER